jgi:hypothetical protein
MYAVVTAPSEPRIEFDASVPSFGNFASVYGSPTRGWSELLMRAEARFPAKRKSIESNVKALTNASFGHIPERLDAFERHGIGAVAVPMVQLAHRRDGRDPPERPNVRRFWAARNRAGGRRG